MLLDTLPYPTVMPGSRIHLHGIAWSMYSNLLKTFAASPGVRLTYDRGELEIMSPLLSHEDDSRFFYCLILILAEEWNTDFKHGGSVTLRRKLEQRGLEPDECFWIENAPRMEGKRRLDLRTDPPPDLCVEIEATRSALNRMSIYAELGVPEVWRLTNKGLMFFKRGSRATYRSSPTSRTFPGLTSKAISEFLAQFQEGTKMLALLRKFRTFAKAHRP